MKISVLIAVPWGDATIADALAGVSAQTHTDWELVVLETGATPAIAPFLAPGGISSGAIRHEHVPGLAPAAARNRLLDLAQGEALAFLEPNEAWLPRHLANAAAALENGADVVVANLRVHEPSTDRLLSETAVPQQLASTPARTLFNRDPVPSASCVVLRALTARTAGRFDERFQALDLRDLLLRCAVDGAKFVPGQKPTVRAVRRRATGDAALRLAEETVQFYEKHRDLSAVPAALRRRMLAGSLVAHGRLLRPIDAARAAKCFWRAWSLQPVHVQTLGQYALTEWRVAKPTEPRDVT